LSSATFSSDLLAVFVFAYLSCILPMRTECKPNLRTHKKDSQLFTIHSIPAYFLHIIHVSQCTGPGKGCSTSWFYCCMLSSGWVPGIWILCANASEHTVPFS
jgi:hypothetical protein